MINNIIKRRIRIDILLYTKKYTEHNKKRNTTIGLVLLELFFSYFLQNEDILLYIMR